MGECKRNEDERGANRGYGHKQDGGQDIQRAAHRVGAHQRPDHRRCALYGVRSGPDREGERPMSLYAVAVKARGADYWHLYLRLFASWPQAQEWAAQTWDGTGCETQIVRLEGTR